jgi:hypothetical protein
MDRRARLELNESRTILGEHLVCAQAVLFIPDKPFSKYILCLDDGLRAGENIWEDSLCTIFADFFIKKQWAGQVERNISIQTFLPEN